MSTTKKLVFTALCIALGVALPLAFHGIPGAGRIFLPMHIPVLLCGLLFGWQAGLACGIVTPIVSALLTSMPAFAILPGMTLELAVYGFAAGLFIHLFRSQKLLIGVYLALILAMLCGRVAGGLVNGFVFQAGVYTLQMWLTASFVTALPGIAAQLLSIPPVVAGLRRSRLIAP